VTSHQKSLIAMTVVGNIAEFFDLFLIGFIIKLLLDDPAWNLTGIQAGIIGAAAGVGTVVGAVMWGRLADRFGRRNAFVACIIVLVFFTFISIFTPVNGWLFLAVARVGVCIGVGGLNITSIPFVQEFVPAKQRGVLAGLTSVFIPGGILLGSLCTKFFAPYIGWRGLLAIGCIPIVLLIWARFIPESPRFLMSRGREKEARAAYAWAMEISPEEVGVIPVPKETKSASYTLVFTKYPKQLAIVAVGSFFIILGIFALQTWGQGVLGDAFKFDLDMVTNLFIIVSLGDMAGRFGSAWISDRIGRRKTMAIFASLGAAGTFIAAFAAKAASQTYQKLEPMLKVVNISDQNLVKNELMGGEGNAGKVTQFMQNHASEVSALLDKHHAEIDKITSSAEYHTLVDQLWMPGIIFFIGILILMTFGDGTFGILNAFGAEQFPTSARSTAIGLGYGIGALSKIAGPLIIGLAIGQGTPTPTSIFVPLLVFGALLLVGGLLYLGATETAGKQLESIE
ncbi:MAG: MFS transporter, partial [Actinomycetaceae bacterium]|nr:MFS transporter [Actinomycetaceae bacterium]